MEKENYSFIHQRIGNCYKEAGKDWRKDMPYVNRPFAIQGLLSVDIEDMIEFNVGMKKGHIEEPPYTLVLLKNGKVLFISIGKGMNPKHKVLGEDGWVYADDMTKEDLIPYMR